MNAIARRFSILEFVLEKKTNTENLTDQAAVLNFMQVLFDCAIDEKPTKEAARMLTDLYEIDDAIRIDLIVYLRDGEGHPGALLDKLLGEFKLSKNSTSTTSSTIEASAMLLELLKQTKSAVTDQLNHAKVREILVDMKPNFWVEINDSSYGRGAIPNPDYNVFAMTAPLDLAGLHAQPVISSSQLTDILKAVFRDRSTWPRTRHKVLTNLGTLYVYIAGSSLLSGGTNHIAKYAGEAQVGLRLQAACEEIQDLEADLIDLERMGRPSALNILLAIDRCCAPNLPPSAAWNRIHLEAGEDLVQLWVRVRTEGSRLNKSLEEMMEKVRYILCELISDEGTCDAAAVADIFNDKCRVAEDAAALTSALQQSWSCKLVLTGKTSLDTPKETLNTSGSANPDTSQPPAHPSRTYRSWATGQGSRARRNAARAHLRPGLSTM